MKLKRWLIVALFAAVVLGVFLSGAGEWLSLTKLKSEQANLHAYVKAEPWRASAIFFAIYTGATAASIPGAIVLTLAAGAIFGTLWGLLLVSFASSLGATLAFLLSRYLFKPFVQQRFGHRLEGINRGIRNDGPLYLLTLRLIPVVPYFLVNLLLALTPIAVRHFYLYSQIGMLPATLIYVNAGTQLAAIRQIQDIASPTVLISLGLLALFPVAAKIFTNWLKRRRFIERFPPPPSAERNLIVIGAGSAGLVASVIAAAVKAKVTLIEAEQMGGDCLNTGCVPSKALLHIAEQAYAARHAAALGVNTGETNVDFAVVMQKVRAAIAAIAPHDSKERYESMGVECIRGRARVHSPYEVEVNGRRLSTRAIVLATGASPLVPEIPGLEQVHYRTSDTLWELKSLPQRLLVLGGGPIGCELAQAFCRLGSNVTVMEMAPRLLPREDNEAGDLLAQQFSGEGITLMTSTRALSFSHDNGTDQVHFEGTEDGVGEGVLPFDVVLLALGRVANTTDLGLEELGIDNTARGTVELNDYLQTNIPTIFACGDLAGPYQFTHTASHQAWYASVNALFRGFKQFRVDHRVIPWCTFTDPAVARVGLNEAEAKQRAVAYEMTRYELSALDRAITDNSRQGYVKVLTVPHSDRILGATIVGAHAGEMIHEFVLAMKHKLGLKKILATIHIYPSFNEANKHAAGQWQRAHAPQRVLQWLEKFHRWRRQSRDKRQELSSKTTEVSSGE